MQKPALLELTSTRFFAAFAVLLGHFNQYLGLPGWIAQWISGGHYVGYFFALSGFILSYRYWEEFERGVAVRQAHGYYVARIARIYPSYVLALLLLTIMYVAMSAARPGSVTYPANAVTSWLANLFAIQTFARSYATQQYWNAPAWSISTEFCFYALFPFLVAWMARHCRTRASLLWVLAAVMAFAVAAQAANLILVYVHGWDRTFWVDIVASRNIIWRLQQFVIGVVAARLLYGGHWPALGSEAIRNRLLIGCLVAIALANALPSPRSDVAAVVMRQLIEEIVFAFPFAGVIVALAAGRTVLSGFLQRPLMVLLGEASYGIYIFHWIPWVALAFSVNQGWVPRASVVTGVILLTILFSIGCYIWYERPVRQLLRRRFGPRGH